jgi:hypothetical protein
MYQEHAGTPKRATNTTRFVLLWLSRWFNGRQTLTVGTPQTCTRWHCQGFRLYERLAQKAV